MPASEPAGARFALIVADLRTRLRPVCGHFDEDEFEALVHRIALSKLRWSHSEPRR